ncbi:MAG: UvrD-helicase domain-containing protein [Chloroflexota bacterium]
MSSLLDQFSFKGRQEQAATASRAAIAVTAGAGSGKTLSLVGRYLHLLEQGYPIRSLIAITFTDKAAREMRNRIRQALGRLPAAGEPDAASAELAAQQVDAARIGTIHGLCAEILRAHPAEAGIDPGFTVLEEGLAAAYQAEAVALALAWAAGDAHAAGLFAVFKENELRRILTALLGARPDLLGINPAPDLLTEWGGKLEAYCAQWLDSSGWLNALATLEALKSPAPDDKLEMARVDVLAHWADVQQAGGSKDWDGFLAGLVTLRKATSTLGRKGNWAADDLEAVRQAMTVLRQVYDDNLKTLAEKSCWALDAHMAQALPGVHLLYDRALHEYQRMKDEQQALDFDDLEKLTARLLTTSADVRARWQSETRAVLVDEFQDTNERQRQIVYALVGFDPADISTQTSDLFVVGDAKQSIYKFRGADVAVFRQVQKDIREAGGLHLDLDLTFRAHRPLLNALNALLAPVLGAEAEVSRPYQVAFAPLSAYRQSPEMACPPYVELLIGLGEDAESGRAVSAAALACRLGELRNEEGFDWGQMALLFRSSTAYAAYEMALERAGIPFVTIAGRGFYDRPEIRDLLNALAAIANPGDNLALAGLLRSPGIGMTDASLYRLRYSGDALGKQPLWESLRGSTLASAVRAYRIINDLHTLSGRSTVADVLKRYLDSTGYRAILASVPEGARMRRNVDKLLADAHRSRLVGVGDFLNYVQTLRDVGLREGEAPVEAGGAVQLMSVHKAKGLEFPLVVIADAAYEHRGGLGKTLLDGNGNLLIDVRDAASEQHAVVWQLASLEDADKEDAEDRRLLYVACTRAKEKLLINGHAKLLKSSAPGLKGWLKRLGDVIGLGEISVDENLAFPHALKFDLVESADAIACTLYPSEPGAEQDSLESPVMPELLEIPRSDAAWPDLVAPLLPPPLKAADDKIRSREADPPQRVWRVVPKSKRAVGPAWVVGKLVHEALRYWRFPDERFDDFIRPFALEAGLTDPAEMRATLHEVRRLLERFRAHPLCAEIESARRYHEVPYVSAAGPGIIDLLYQTSTGWVIADFKTDAVRSEAEARELIRSQAYDQQVQRYAQAFADQSGQVARTVLVFLQVGNAVQVFAIS